MSHSEYDDVTERQLKNSRRKLVAFIWDAPAKRIIEFCLMVGIKLPANLINKYISKDFDS
jgi:hypothetical protein